MNETTQENETRLAELEMLPDAADAPLAAAPQPARPGETGSRPDDHGRAPSHPGAWLVWVGNIFALLWVGAVGAFLWGFLGLQSLDSLTQYGFGQLTGMAVFALAPALLLITAGLMGREIVANASNTRRVEYALRHLAEPSRRAEDGVRSLADAVSGEVERINAAMDSALARLAAMEEVISHHAETLEQSAGDARERTESLLAGLRKERLRLSEVSESLDDKAALIAAAISDQSKMVAAAAELAASQAKDTEEKILASVDTLNDASTKISERGQLVSAKIGDRTDELRDMSNELKSRSEGLDAAYLKHRERLTEASESLRQEQEKIAAALDFHRAELDVMAKTARDGAEALNSATTEGASAFKDAVEKALGRAQDLAGHIRSETDYAAREHESALARLVAAAQEAKEISDAAIHAVEAQADVIAEKVEKTNEAAFDAAKRSDETFELRLSEAEKLTARAAQAADDAAETVKRRLEAVLASARAETQTVERQLEHMTERLSEMPVMARERAQEAADTLRRGLEGLNAASLAAAEEAQDIDAAFQSRIRQNYELLSDFMLRMGSVAGGRRAPDLGLNEVPAPLSRKPRKNEAASESTREQTFEAEDAVPDTDEMNTPLTGQPAQDEASPASSTASDKDVRGRADNTVGFPERQPRAANEPGWRWKDLLSTMPNDDDQAKKDDPKRR